ncbi:Rho-activating domain of cytotoxic necrotizing factor [Izhakiella capsodis]|uniref:Rho-activating domain of cytotoxic necrotizing factor n=1 Tax=Izhakiella capsodis TaxID=1367852 RepID=A0A1I5A037_9GAMM|nr:cytotoxic necrotizing factor Rho-activating domain-containing protein [Izhakiella capsodis]SFN55760.1 Rho-activating domain of cytotoxic necrotizing factor [Izhakiella capsodis]
MKVFNNSRSYTVNNITAPKINSKDNNSQFTNSVKSAKNTPITMIRRFFNHHFSHSGGEKKPNMRELISKSYVLPDSGCTARSNFIETSRFNRVVTKLTTGEKKELLKESASVMNGNIRPFIGKGIISMEAKNDNLPVTYDYIISDKNHGILRENISSVNFGIECYNGDKIKSAEIIPGTPIGNYYNKQTFNHDLKIIQLDSGNCGTVGFRLDINQLTPDRPLLIHGGELSGCTMVYGLKDNYFYAFHSGQPGNDKSIWETKKDGSKSIIESHNKMTGSTSDTDKEIDIETLSSYLHDNFDICMMAFCGHGETIGSKKKVLSFDYNKPSILVGENKSRVANTMAMLVNKGGVIEINMLSDDMTIDKKTLETDSMTYVLSGPIEKPIIQN